MRNVFPYLLFIVLATACGNPPAPKPEGLLRVDLPERNYRTFDSTGYPYRFQCPGYANITADTQDLHYERYWINLKLPADATLHISYKRVNNNLPELLDDTHNFVYRHVIKADAITETPFAHPSKKVYGLLYEIGGDAASSVQFYATDSTRHFLRGALYFQRTPDHDFLAPIISYYTTDIIQLIETLEWK